MATNSNNTDKKRAQALAERFIHHPEMLERIESILDIAESDESGSLDQVEERLVELVRELGGQTLEGWLERKEQSVAKKTKAAAPRTQQREKKR